MKKAILMIMALMFFSPAADACVGKVLNIGVINSPDEQVLAEMLSTLITERTGTTVAVKLYANTQDLYGAVKKEQVDILVENTARAMRVLNKPAEKDAKKAYDVVKTAYEKEKGLVWLKPFGFLNGAGGDVPSHTSTVLRTGILANFPALPRVINKLGGIMNDEAYAKLLHSAKSGEKPKKVARDFLKSRKLI